MKLGVVFLITLCISSTKKLLADKKKLVSILYRDILIIKLMFICSLGGKESRSFQNRLTGKIFLSDLENGSMCRTDSNCRSGRCSYNRCLAKAVVSEINIFPTSTSNAIPEYQDRIASCVEKILIAFVGNVPIITQAIDQYVD